MEQKTEDVSLILPAYQAQGTIGEAIGAVLRGAVLPRQIIVVDDGSRDRTAETAEQYRGRAEKASITLTVLKTTHNGVSAARNAGIEHAVCAWLVFCDADDRVRQGWLSELYAAKSERRLALCGYCEAGREVVPEMCGDVPRAALMTLYAAWLLNSCCNKIYSAEKIRASKLRFDTDCAFGEDLRFNLSYIKETDGFFVIAAALYDYFPSKTKLSKRTRVARQRGVYRQLKVALLDMGEFSAPARRLFYRTRRAAILYEIKN